MGCSVVGADNRRPTPVLTPDCGQHRRQSLTRFLPEENQTEALALRVDR